MKKIPLHLQIIVGMVVGVVVGLALSFSGNSNFAVFWIKPFGTIFLNLLKMIAVPLVLVSLINGVTNLTDISRLSALGTRTIVLYLFTTLLAISLGVGLANLFEPGAGFSAETRAALSEKYGTDAQKRQESAGSISQQSPLQPLVEMIPSNVFASMTDNKAMLQLIVFAVLFGIAAIIADRAKVAPVKAFFEGLDEIILKLVGVIMQAAPIGVFALLAALIADFAGDDPSRAAELLLTLGYYSLVVLLGLALMILLVYPLMLRFLANYDYRKFFKALLPAQMMAFSTSSSAATLPVTMNQVEKELGVSPETSSFVLPLGATVNMDGTSLYQGVAAIFIAQAYGLDLTFSQQIGIILTTTLASIGTAAVPGAGVVMLIIVLEQAGIPASGIALIMAPDRILDMCRTVVNITSDATVALIVDKSSKKTEQTN